MISLILCFILSLWSCIITATVLPPYAAVPNTGPNCNGLYNSCGWPMIINVTSPVSMIGSIAYAPTNAPVSLQVDGLINLRVLIFRHH